MHNEIDEKIVKLSSKLKNIGLIEILKSKIEEILGDDVTFGAEIEFYSLKYSIDEVSSKLPEYNFIKERGVGQIEYHIGPAQSLSKFMSDINESRKKIEKILQDEVDFSPKPFSHDFGNALQIQISSRSKLFQQSLDEICAGFCFFAKKTFLAFAQTNSCYKRFDSNYMAPSYISYGLNNRSCLIRICGNEFKRIEVRAASNNCDLYVLISTILMTIYKSLIENKRTDIYQRIYGNSFDSQYSLEKIPENIKIARELFDEEFYKI